MCVSNIHNKISRRYGSQQTFNKPKNNDGMKGTISVYRDHNKQKTSIKSRNTNLHM